MLTLLVVYGDFVGVALECFVEALNGHRDLLFGHEHLALVVERVLEVLRLLKDLIEASTSLVVVLSVEVRLALVVQRSHVTWSVLECLGIARQSLVVSLLLNERVAKLSPGKTPSENKNISSCFTYK